MAHFPVEPAENGSNVHLRIPPEARYLRTVRDAIAGFGTFHGVDSEDLDLLTYAVGEALANAVEHSRSNEDINFFCHIDRATIVARVIDSGDGCDMSTETQPFPDTLSARGRGVPIMQHFTDIFDVQTRPGAGTTVTLGRFRAQ